MYLRGHYINANIRRTVTLTVITKLELKEEERAMPKIALASPFNTYSIMTVSAIVMQIFACNHFTIENGQILGKKPIFQSDFPVYRCFFQNLIIEKKLKFDIPFTR